jgi:hypothetical protein
MEFVVDDELLGRVFGPFLGHADVTEEYVPVLVSDWPTGIALEDVDRLLGAGSTFERAGELRCISARNAVSWVAAPSRRS